jgi:hypothetical protein
MKRTISTLTVVAFLLFAPSFLSAQATSGGSMAVTATVESSISLTLENDASGVSMTGAGSNSATLAFGNIYAYGSFSTTGVTRSTGASDFTVSTPFGVKVIKANSSSSDYSLTAALNSADATNTWKIDSVTLSTTAQSIAATSSYGSAVQHTLHLDVLDSASSGDISNTVNFTATAN